MIFWQTQRLSIKAAALGAVFGILAIAPASVRAQDDGSANGASTQPANASEVTRIESQVMRARTGLEEAAEVERARAAEAQADLRAAEARMPEGVQRAQPLPQEQQTQSPNQDDADNNPFTKLFGFNKDKDQQQEQQPTQDDAPSATLIGPNVPGMMQEDVGSYKKIIDAHYEKALSIASQMADSSDPFLRANAIEALQPVPERVLLLVQKGLNDPATVVRFASLVTIGKLKFDSLGSQTVKYFDDPSLNVQVAAIYAAHETGQNAPLSKLSHFISSQYPSVRRNAALILRLLGDPSAIPMIIDLATRRTRKSTPQQLALARIDAAQTVVELGDESEIEVIRAAAYSGYPEVRVIAILALGQLEDRIMQPAVEQIMRHGMPEQAPEVSLAAAQALADMGDSSGLPLMLKYAQTQAIEFDGNKYPTTALRAQAAAGLGYLKAPQAAQMLAKLLDDPAPQVRIAAAAEIIKAYNAMNALATWGR